MTDDCTCHPYDNPPRPCPQKYALGACRLADAEARADHALALVAEAYEVAADTYAQHPSIVLHEWEDCQQSWRHSIYRAILDKLPSDALAAREARDKRIRDEALREAANMVVFRSGEYNSFDAADTILALIKENPTND